MKALHFVWIFLACAWGLQAQLRLPSVIGDNMVLKRNSTVRLWGWDESVRKVRVVAEWNPADTLEAVCDMYSRFEVKLETPQAGGPYKLTFLGSSSKVVENVMIGEVWLCSGQSNMQFSWNTSYGTPMNTKEDMKTADKPNIRLMNVQRVPAKTPQNYCFGEWEICSPETLPDYSCVAYYFAERLHEMLNIPIGIVVSAWGGTPAEIWAPAEALDTIPAVRDEWKKIKPNIWWPTYNGEVYNGMIAPLVPFSFSGAIWYQGESNRERYAVYDRLMRALIDGWRADFETELPFYFVQIAPLDGYEVKGQIPYLREQQALTAQYPGCGMVATNDLVDDIKNIHPGNKKDVGMRLANLALNKTYGDTSVDCSYPEIAGVKPEGNKLIATFKGVNAVTQVSDKNTGFEIAGEDGVFVPARIKIINKNKTIKLWSPEVKNPRYLRYLFDDSSVCCIKGSNGLPMLPYRNDK